MQTERPSTDKLGIYISVPFCKAKCTYCNFASGVFGAPRMEAYVDRLCAEIHASHSDWANGHAIDPSRRMDTLFFGGGTPSLLSAAQIRRIFTALRSEFELLPGAEITLECAPGQLDPETLDELLRQGMNRISFGVQSFIDREAAAVGRLHTREMCLAEIERLRSAGVSNINVDLIAGLPHQTASSWRESVEVAIATRVPHVSIYMLEVDEDSRLGREMLGLNQTTEGSKYGAASTPSEDETAEWYAAACTWLESVGIRQYEISNFAREGSPSRHNLKYWRREPYLGFGLDAHSMLRHGPGAVRRANTSDLDAYLAGAANHELPLLGSASPHIEKIGREQAFEEALFLGLRMNEGVNLNSLRAEFGEGLVGAAVEALGDVAEAGLVEHQTTHIRLTARGHMVSNEVFSRLLVTAAA
jgi:oxygen-independent coproporphyrinogen III oxidase